MSTCREIMTPAPECSLASDTAAKAALLMKTKNVGPIPVVDDHSNKRLLGIVTDRDLTIKIVAERRSAGTKVEAIMTQDPVTRGPEEDLEKALALMAEHQVRRIPIVDEQGQLLGIISQADVALRSKSPQKTAEVVEEISKPASGSAVETPTAEKKRVEKRSRRAGAA